MVDTISADGPEEAPSSPVPYKDRSAGLTVFGILTILLGCFAGLMVLMVFLQTVVVGSPPGSQVNFSIMVPSLTIYGVMAVALVWLGIGSIMARRWARALLLIFSWSWLLVGVVAIVSLAFILPRIIDTINANGPAGQPAMSPAIK